MSAAVEGSAGALVAFFGLGQKIVGQHLRGHLEQFGAGRLGSIFESLIEAAGHQAPVEHVGFEFFDVAGSVLVELAHGVVKLPR